MYVNILNPQELVGKSDKELQTMRDSLRVAIEELEEFDNALVEEQSARYAKVATNQFMAQFPSIFNS